MKAKIPTLLVILDGWGIGSRSEGNAIDRAPKPTFDTIKTEYPMFSLQASGIAVGLPWNEPGNSEVGHLTLGAGKTLFQYLPRINTSIRDGSFFTNEKMLRAAQYVKEHNSAFHITGLFSTGTVHSSMDHLKALLEFAAQQELPKVFLHVISDGRDSYPKNTAQLLSNFIPLMQRVCPQAKIASVIGRTFAMDRDDHWDRTQLAFDLITQQKGKPIKNIIEYIYEEYALGHFDDVISPAVITENGSLLGPLQENDVLFFFNFREDSMRQIARSFTQQNFDHFPASRPQGLFVLTMTKYIDDVPLNYLFDTVFEKEIVKMPLARLISEAGMRQLHIAETEKYAHITFFFNGETEQPFPGEERILVPSLPMVNFAEHPEMSAAEITQHLQEAISGGQFDFIVANYANADMIGHTGNFPAIVQAIQVLDKQIATLLQVTQQNGWCMLITGDHGNADDKIDLTTGEVRSGHSPNPVPLHIIHSSLKNCMTNLPEYRLHDTSQGILADVAPTVLYFLGLPKPSEMTGHNMLNLIPPQPQTKTSSS